jgi:hypothetical protein
MKTTSRFWPFDLDPEVEIYENPSWDLPGLKRQVKRPPANRKRDAQKSGR